MAEYSCVKSTKLVLKGAKEKRWGAGCPPPLPLPWSPRLWRRLRAGASAALPPSPLPWGRVGGWFVWGQARPSRPVPPAASMPGHGGEGRGFRLSAPFSRLVSVTRCGGARERGRVRARCGRAGSEARPDLFASPFAARRSTRRRRGKGKRMRQSNLILLVSRLPGIMWRCGNCRG